MKDEGTTGPEPSPRRTWTTLAKATVTLALLGILLRSGSLDPAVLGRLTGSASMLVATVSTWLVVSVFLAALRYRSLLRTIDVSVPAGRSLALQLGSLFFNTIIPGNVGGDLWRSVEVSRAYPERRGSLLFVVLLERTLGLSALFATTLVVWGVTGALEGSWSFDTGWPGVFVSLAAALVGGPLVAALVSGHPAIDRWLRRGARTAPAWARLLRAKELFAHARRALLGAYGVAMVMHLVCLVYFWFLARSLPGAALPLQAVAVAFPLGIVSVILPVSLAGLGVGHVAFEGLFRSFGADGGANVFNLYMVGQLSLNLLGGFAVLVVRRRARALARV